MNLQVGQHPLALIAAGRQDEQKRWPHLQSFYSVFRSYAGTQYDCQVLYIVYSLNTYLVESAVRGGERLKRLSRQT